LGNRPFFRNLGGTMIAGRVKHIEASGIRKVFELVATMEDPVNLSIGQADYDPPVELQEAAVRAIRGGWNRYSVTQGFPELNEKILDRYEEIQGVRPEASMLTCGVSGGVLLSFLCLLEAGDEILLPDPYFMMYRHLALMCGAEPKYYSLYPDFRPSLGEIESLLSKRTKIILVNSPSNPTGGVFAEEELRKIGEMADKAGAVLVSDEIYEQFVYEGPFVSPGRFAGKSLVLGGFSKTFGIPGWRQGFALGPAEIIEPMRTLQQFTFVCAPTPFQRAILDTWGLDMSGYVKAYVEKRRILVEGLDPVFRLVPPQGSFYAFPSYPEGLDPGEFLEKALARKVLVVPGSAFSSRNTHFRISFAAPDEKIREGVRILNEIARGG